MKRRKNKNINVPVMADERGFTLLETILALSIVTVIVGVLLMAMRLGISSWEKGGYYVEVTGMKRSLVEMLNRDLSSIYPYMADSESGGSDEKEFVFMGKPDSILFVTSSRTSVTIIPWGGLRWVHYGVDEGGFVIREKTVPSESMLDEEGGERFEMEPGVSAVDFSYFGEDGWVESWNMTDTQRLPGAVKARFSFTDDRETQSMIIPVALMQPTYNGGLAEQGRL